MPASEPAQRPFALSTDALAGHAIAWAGAGGLATVLWLLGSPGESGYWPRWIWFAGAVLLSLHIAARCGDDAARRIERENGGGGVETFLAYKIPLGVCSAVIVALVWAATGFDASWPLWAWAGIAGMLAIEAGSRELLRRRRRDRRERELAEQVGELRRTRRGALEVEAAELRRLERDLHDGAQSRLVALSMQLGRAEEKLADRPEVAELIREARAEAGGAIAELRDLARGIAPPVLADRGLEAAVEALADRSGASVSVQAAIPRRPTVVVETAAYFVVAEALTNVAKHAAGAAARVDLALGEDALVIRVSDEGPGGADGAGGGLSGLRGRVEALDGELSLRSPLGAGTMLEAVIPCEP